MDECRKEFEKEFGWPPQHVVWEDGQYWRTSAGVLPRETDYIAAYKGFKSAWNRRTTPAAGQQDDETKDLRRLLADIAGSALMYRDDGELQDNSTHPTIDYLRDDVDYIRWALMERKKKAEQPPAANAAQDVVTIPVNPTDGLLMSMALRYDHGLGLAGYYDQFPRWEGDTHEKRLAATISDMRKIHEEVVGTGFYRPEKEADYIAMKTPAKREG